jgi:hypothetical protein
MKRTKLDLERTHCHACDRITNWIPKRRGNFLRCDGGCGGRFPCGHLCRHLECRLQRGDSLEKINVRATCEVDTWTAI